MPIPGGTVGYDQATVNASTLPAFSATDSPFDLSSLIDLSSEMTLSRGRPDEFSTVEPGSCSFRAEVVSATRGATDILPSDWVQVTESAQDGSGSSRRFRGRVDTQIVSWDATARMALVDVTVTDRLAQLQRHTLRAMRVEEVMADSPTSYYMLDDADGSTSAADSSLHANPPLTVPSWDTGTPVAFGTDVSSVDGFTAATFAASGQVLQGTPTSLVLLPASGWTLGLRVRVAAPPPSGRQQVLFATNTDYSLQLVDTGQVNGIGPDVCDGQEHHLMPCQSGGTVTYYDGVAVGTDTFTSGDVSWFSLHSLITLVDVTMWDVVTFPTVLSAARILAHAQAGSAFTGETTAARAARLAGYARVAVADTSFAGSHVMGPQATSGVATLDALQQVAVVENSQVYVDGSGVLTMRDSHHRTLNATSTPAVTIDVDQVELGTDIQIKYQDKTYLENRVTGTRDGGTQQQLDDAISQADYDVYPKDLGTIAAADDQTVLNLIDQELTGHSQPIDRINQVSISLTNLEDVSLVAALLALELGDRLQITGLPTTAPSTTADLIVEGISESRTADWTLTLNTSPVSIYQRFILGDPVFGVLGAGYHLAY